MMQHAMVYATCFREGQELDLQLLRCLGPVLVQDFHRSPLWLDLPDATFLLLLRLFCAMLITCHVAQPFVSGGQTTVARTIADADIVSGHHKVALGVGCG